MHCKQFALPFGSENWAMFCGSVGVDYFHFFATRENFSVSVLNAKTREKKCHFVGRHFDLCFVDFFQLSLAISSPIPIYLFLSELICRLAVWLSFFEAECDSEASFCSHSEDPSFSRSCHPTLPLPSDHLRSQNSQHPSYTNRTSDTQADPTIPYFQVQKFQNGRCFAHSAQRFHRDAHLRKSKHGTHNWKTTCW